MGRLLLLLAGGALTSCSGGMEAIDARTRRLLMERSAQLDGDTAAPAPRTYPDVDLGRQRLSDTSPPSVNPPASSLEFSQASEDRNVALRLEEYTASALDFDSAPRLEIDLPAALRLAQSSSREYVAAEEDYVLAALRLLIERHRWSPRLFNDTSVAVTGSGDDGSFQTALRLINELRVTQRLPWGGDVAARWVTQATQDLRSRASEEYVQSSSLILDAGIPLLRGAGLVAREDLIQAERELVYAARDFERFRREFLVSVSNDFFRLLQQQARIDSQQQQIASQEQSLRRTRALVEAGELRAFQEAIAENGLRNAQSSLASLNQQYVLLLERFKVRLGLDPRTPVTVLPLEFDLPEPLASQAEAALAAVNYRLDLQNQRDRLDDARRAVLNARNNLLPDLNIDAAATIPTDPDRDVGRLDFSPGDANFSLGATFGLPLDRVIERAQLRQAMIGLARRERDYTRFRDNVIVDARAALREIELARFRLQLAERQVEIALRRQEEQRIDPAGVTAQEELDTSNDLLNARNERDAARTDLRSAVLDYLLQTGQLRVAPDGPFLPLPGMDAEPAADPVADDRREVEPIIGEPLPEDERAQQPPPAPPPPPGDG